MKSISRALMALFGWSVKGEYSDAVRDCVIVVAPHTSNWDFWWGILARNVYGINARYLIKDSFFKPGIGWFFRWTGGVPVDRSKKNDLTERLVAMLKMGKGLKVVFTPEGTRKRVDKWRSGFYWVAFETGLPIVMHYIDYEKKEVGMSEPFIPTGDWQRDKPIFEAFYAPIAPNTPENFNLKF